jgi:hypothetical protein
MLVCAQKARSQYTPFARRKGVALTFELAQTGVREVHHSALAAFALLANRSFFAM